MQPCPNCGRTEVTPAGNCQNCGLFRGNDAYGTASSSYSQNYPQPVDPYSATPYPAAPHSADPYSAPPHSADPYSAPPYQGQQPYQGQSYEQPYQQGYQQPQAQPQYGYQDPNAYQAPPQSSRRPSTVPLIVLSVVAVILVIGIVSVVVVRAGGSGGNGTGNGNGNGNTGTNASGIDKCVVGTWSITSVKEKVDVDGTLAEFSARGGTVELKDDGSGKIDYGSGVTYTGKISGQNVTITFTGSISYSFKTSDGSFTFSNVKPNGTASVKVNGVQTTSIPLDMETTPSKYECSGNTMTQSTDLSTMELSKR